MLLDQAGATICHLSQSNKPVVVGPCVRRDDVERVVVAAKGIAKGKAKGAADRSRSRGALRPSFLLLTTLIA
jgi:hypothetical protein